MISKEKRELGSWLDGGKASIELEEVHVVPPGQFSGEKVCDWQEVNDLIRGIRESGRVATFVSAATSSGVINPHESCDPGRGIEGIDFGFDKNPDRVESLLKVEMDGIIPKFVWATGPSPIRSVNQGLINRFKGLTKQTGLIYQVDFELTTGDSSALAGNIPPRAKGDSRKTAPVVELIWSNGGKTAERITDPRRIRALLSTNGAGGAILAAKYRVSPMLPHESLLIVTIDENDSQRFHGLASGHMQARMLPWIVAGNLGLNGETVDYAEIVHSSGLDMAIRVSTMLDSGGKLRTAQDAQWYKDHFLQGAVGSLAFGVRHGDGFNPENSALFDAVYSAWGEAEGKIKFADVHFVDSRDPRQKKAVHRVHAARKAVPYEARRRSKVRVLRGLTPLDTASYDSDYGVLVDSSRAFDPSYQDACARRFAGLSKKYTDGRRRMEDELGAETIDTGHGLAFFPQEGYDPDARGLSGRHDRHWVEKGRKSELVLAMQGVETEVGVEAFSPEDDFGVRAEQDRLGEKSYPNDGPAWAQYANRRPGAAGDTFRLIQKAGPHCNWRMHPAMKRVGEQLLGKGAFDRPKKVQVSFEPSMLVGRITAK